MAANEAKVFADAIVRRVDQIVDCLAGLSDEEINRTPPVPEANSLLVLAVHTMANVEENVFEVVGGQPVGRDRESEFRASGGSAEQVQQDWQSLRGRVEEFLNSANPEILDREIEHHRYGKRTGREALMLAATHAAEHAGHAELTRDWIRTVR